LHDGLGAEVGSLVERSRPSAKKGGDVSDSNLVSAIILILVANVAVNFWLSKVANDYRDGIISGVLRGVRLNVHHRSHILWSDWLPLKSSLAFMCAFVALGYVKIGRIAQDAEVASLAYLASLLFFLGFAFYLLLGASDLLYCLKSLRAGKDAP
jgi:hypothetical protein